MASLCSVWAHIDPNTCHKDCQIGQKNRCQRDCQNRCQIACQKVCQIDCQKDQQKEFDRRSKSRPKMFTIFARQNTQQKLTMDAKQNIRHMKCQTVCQNARQNVRRDFKSGRMLVGHDRQNAKSYVKWNARWNVRQYGNQNASRSGRQNVLINVRLVAR